MVGTRPSLVFGTCSYRTASLLYASLWTLSGTRRVCTVNEGCHGANDRADCYGALPEAGVLSFVAKLGDFEERTLQRTIAQIATVLSRKPGS